ncbi:activator-dependent family glycosyltransferase [Actinomadura sp. NPDC047616]|uniref:activator-dependent family glycosyltransferase n=1 Tax=Actinomadura sp. NPDC047616 TaxID=3155914 RepID=UPI0033FD7DEB
MRVLFVTAAFKSHLYVQVPLATAFRNAGHEVRVAAPPEMVDAIAETGLTGIPVGTTIPLDVMMDQAEPDRGPDRSGLPVRRPPQTDYTRDDPFAELETTAFGGRTLFNHDDTFEDLVRFARDWRPDVIIRDPFMYCGAVAARASGAADARMLFGADTPAQIRADCYGAHGGLHRSDGRPDPLRDWLEPILERYGCAFDEEVVLGRWTVIGWPPWTWRPTDVHYLPTRPVSYHGPHTVEEWMYRRPDRPRVCLTLGISHRDLGFGHSASIDTLFEAVADLDAEIIATFDDKQLATASAVPDNVRPVDFVPLNVLMPTCSAIVHHGGYGPMTAALEHGVPQLIVPNIYWSEKWWGPVALAKGLEEQGAGAYVADADQVTADLLHDHLVKALTDPAMAENAARLRDEHFAVPGPNDTVRVFEKLIAEHARGES